MPEHRFPACYMPHGDPARPFRPVGLVKALLAFDVVLRTDVLEALDRGQSTAGGDRRCTWGDAEAGATTPLARHVVGVLVRDVWGRT